MDHVRKETSFDPLLERQLFFCQLPSPYCPCIKRMQTCGSWSLYYSWIWICVRALFFIFPFLLSNSDMHQFVRDCFGL